MHAFMSRIIFKMSMLTVNGIETQTIRLNNIITCKVYNDEREKKRSARLTER